jgi:parvulin-like peptidyl-prolyl isomerase
VRLESISLLGFIFACSLKAQAAETVVARVGDQSISTAQLQQAAQRSTGQAGQALSLADKQDLLDDLVSESLMHQEALRLGLDRDPKVIKVMVNTLLRDQVYSTVRNSDFSEAELRAYFEAHPSAFVVPEKVQVKLLLIRSDTHGEREAKALAEQLHWTAVADPAQFSQLAREHSEEAHRRRGGDLGFISRVGKPGLSSEVVARAFELKAGGISPVFSTAQGYQFVQVLNHRAAVNRSFEQMKGSVLRKLKNEQLTQLYDAFVARLKASERVEVDERVLDQLQLQHSGGPVPPPLGP